MMRPDILFVLRLTDDGSLIWVALQAKWCEAQNGISPGTVLEAMKTVTPSRYFLSKVCVQFMATAAQYTHPFVRRMESKYLDTLKYATKS
jgi:hypothetical protein